MNPALYKLPQGAERLLLDDAFRRQVLTHRIQNLFTRWGYQPVQTPVFDFYDLYAPFLGSAADSVYRLVDREGDLLVLRFDITLFLARAMGVSLRPGHAPLRVCYADTILRHQDLEDISANEFFQIGAEFIGASGPEGDQEILLLLDAVLRALGLEAARVQVGSRALFQAAFGHLASDQQTAALSALLLRRWTTVSQFLTDAASAPAIVRLFQFIGTPAEGRALLAALPDLPPALVKAAGQVLELVATLEELGLTNRFRLDFSEVGRQSYYTGLVFQVYQPDVGDAIAAGGRYDQLFSQFGLDSPSVGFSLHLGKVEALVDFDGLESPAQAPAAPGATLEERWKNAQAARAEGRIVTL